MNTIALVTPATDAIFVLLFEAGIDQSSGCTEVILR